MTTDLFATSKTINLPITTEVRGQVWRLFTYDYMTQDGMFSGYLYALDMGHAEQLLSEMKATAVLSGQMIESIDAAMQEPRAAEGPIPCPQCGQAPKVSTDNEGWTVIHCCRSISRYPTKPQAIEGWKDLIAWAGGGSPGK